MSKCRPREVLRRGEESYSRDRGSLKMLRGFWRGHGRMFIIARLPRIFLSLTVRVEILLYIQEDAGLGDL